MTTRRSNYDHAVREAAVALMESNADRWLYSSEVCEALGVPAGTMATIFTEDFLVEHGVVVKRAAVIGGGGYTQYRKARPPMSVWTEVLCRPW